jgi:hypothetical protein
MKISKIIWKGRIFIFVGILIWLLCAFYHPFEPRYQGKRLSVWVAALSPDSQWEGETKEDRQVATEAVRHIGVRALPPALKACRAHDSVLKEKLMDWSETWNANHEYFQIHFSAEEDAHAKSYAVFKALGSAGEPAIPSLVKLLGDKDESVAKTAAGNLLCTGSNAIPFLIEALTDSNAQRRCHAVMTLGGFGEQAQEAIPIVIRCLADKNPQVQSTAALSLGSLGGQPIVVTALLQCLKAPDASVREMAVASLGQIHREPERVVPALLDYLQTETDASPSSFQVVYALGHFGTNAQPWSPVLAQMIQSNRFGIFTAPALGTLRQIDPAAAKPFLPAP